MTTWYFNFKEYAADEQLNENGFDAEQINCEVHTAIVEDIVKYMNKKNVEMDAKKRAEFVEIWVVTHTSEVMSIINRNFTPVVWLFNYVYDAVWQSHEKVAHFNVVMAISNALHGKKVTEDDINEFLNGVSDADTSEGVYKGLIAYLKTWAGKLPVKDN